MFGWWTGRRRQKPHAGSLGNVQSDGSNRDDYCEWREIDRGRKKRGRRGLRGVQRTAAATRGVKMEGLPLGCPGTTAAAVAGTAWGHTSHRRAARLPRESGAHAGQYNRGRSGQSEDGQNDDEHEPAMALEGMHHLLNGPAQKWARIGERLVQYTDPERKEQLSVTSFEG